MKDLEAYFAYLEGLIRNTPGAQEDLRYRYLSPRAAEVWGTIVFVDGSVLEFYERIVQASNRIQRKHYRYHYMQEGKLIFRYDTAPHHPHLSTHPYHKHDEKGRVLESPPVSLKEVLREISDLLTLE